VVAEGVVDLLEPVQVDQGQRGRDQLAVGLTHRLPGAVIEQGPVGEPGEGVREGLLPDVALVADQERPAAGQQPHAQGEHDRDGHHQGRPSPLGAETGLQLLLLVLGALVQLLGQHRDRRFQLLRLDPAHPAAVAGGHGGQQPVAHLLVALQMDADLVGEPDVVGVGISDDEQHQHQGEPDGGQLATMPARPAPGSSSHVPHEPLRPLQQDAQPYSDRVSRALT
jgi:hypothetical protein